MPLAKRPRRSQPQRLVETLRLAAACALSLLAATAVAQGPPQEVATLRPDEARLSGGFGQLVAVDGPFAAVLSTVVPDGSSQLELRAFIYRQNGLGEWTLVRSTLAATQPTGGWAPGGLVLDGERLFVGQQDEAVIVLERNVGGADAWGVADTIRPDVPNFDLFASDIDVDGDVLVAGAPDFSFPRPGSAYVFERQASGEWLQIDRLRPDDAAPGDRFGRHVAIFGDTLAVSTVAATRPAIYVFERQGAGDFAQVARFDQSDLNAPDLDIQGDLLVASSAPVATAGGATLFERGVAGWRRGAVLEPSAAGPGGAMAARIVLAGELLVLSDQLSGTSGGAWIFRREGGFWNDLGRVEGSDASGGAEFSLSLASDGTHIIFGAPLDAVDGAGVGAAFLFGPDPVVFGDGFESGDVEVWTFATGL